VFKFLKFKEVMSSMFNFNHLWLIFKQEVMSIVFYTKMGFLWCSNWLNTHQNSKWSFTNAKTPIVSLVSIILIQRRGITVLFAIQAICLTRTKEFATLIQTSKALKEQLKLFSKQFKPLFWFLEAQVVLAQCSLWSFIPLKSSKLLFWLETRMF